MKFHDISINRTHNLPILNFTVKMGTIFTEAELMFYKKFISKVYFVILFVTPGSYYIT